MEGADPDSKMPYQLPFPKDAQDEIVILNGVMCYVDPWGKVQGYEDVFTKIDLCREHFAEVGLGEDYVEKFIR